jgi:hypothetical protein
VLGRTCDRSFVPSLEKRSRLGISRARVRYSNPKLSAVRVKLRVKLRAKGRRASENKDQLSGAITIVEVP